MAKSPAKTSDAGDNPFDRALAAMLVGIIVLVVVAFLLLMIGTAGGWLDGPLASAVILVPFIGLPLAIVIMLTLTIRVAVRRSRENRAKG